MSPDSSPRKDSSVTWLSQRARSLAGSVWARFHRAHRRAAPRFPPAVIFTLAGRRRNVRGGHRTLVWRPRGGGIGLSVYVPVGFAPAVSDEGDTVSFSRVPGKIRGARAYRAYVKVCGVVVTVGLVLGAIGLFILLPYLKATGQLPH